VLTEEFTCGRLLRMSSVVGGTPENTEVLRQNLLWIDPNRLYSPPQLAGRLGLDATTVQKWCQSGKLKAHRTRGETGQWRILGLDAMQFLRVRETLPELKIEPNSWQDRYRTLQLLGADERTLDELIARGRKDLSLGIRPNCVVRGAPMEAYLAGVGFAERGEQFFYGAELLRFWSDLTNLCSK
jgi:hypothetical protein